MTLQDALKKELCNKEFKEAYESIKNQSLKKQSENLGRKRNNLSSADTAVRIARTRRSEKKACINRKLIAY